MGLCAVCAPLPADIITGQRQQNSVPQGEAAEPEKLLTEARQVALAGNLVLSRQQIEEARKLSSDLPHTDVLMAEWLLEAGQQGQARALLESLAVSDPGRADLRIVFTKLALLQGRLFDAWVHATAGETGEFPESWSDEFKAARRLEIVRLKAVTAVRRADWQVARTLYEKLYEESETPSDALELARTEFQLGDQEAAEQHVRTACGSDQIEAVAELVLAVFSEQSQQPELCETWFRRGLKLQGAGLRTVQLEFARWLIRNNRPADAAGVLKQGKPGDGSAGDSSTDDLVFVAGLADRMSGRMDTAEAVFAKLHQKTPSSFAVSNQLALVLVESSDEAKRGRALQIATSNARRFPKLEDALATLGWVQYRLGDVEAAEQILTATMADGSVSRDTAYYLAQVKQALGKTSEATRFAEAASSGSGEFFNLVNMKSTQAADLK
jgi:Tfp pilus assembly protein PilF